MWVLQDEDSTIYITGTIHVLRDGMQWRSAKLDAALAESDELWLELAEIAAPEGLMAAVYPVLERFAAYDGTPLSELLTEEENATLHAELQKVGAPQHIFDNLDRMEPWYATYALGLSRSLGGDYDEKNAIDDALARLAVEQGIPVNGMESLEDQVVLMTGASISDQLDELRLALKSPPGLGQAMQRVSDLAYGSWIRGETHMVEALVAMMGISAGISGGSTDPLLADRNANWVDVIEELLDGSGVHFIGVGAAHLVGPDSLFVMLEQRGIKSKRY
jgi:uncharacterized protein YbaP (TraB family)